MKKITFLKSLFVAFLLSCTTLLSAADYVKVTTAPSDWSGTYLIVCEDGNVALTDAVDAANNGTAVTIVDGKITTDANIAFTIAAINGGYSIKAPNEKYIGSTTNNNELKTETTAYTNAISLENDGSVKIVGTSSVLRYNANKDQLRFRYFKASSYTNQKPIQLYKLASEGEGGGDVVEPEPDPEEPTPDPEEPEEPVVPEGTTTETVDLTTGYVNAETLSTVEATNVTLIFDKNTGSNDPKWYSTGTAARLYGNNSLTIKAITGLKLYKVEFTYHSSYAPTSSNSSVSTGVYNYGTHTWTASDVTGVDEMVLTNTASSGHFRIQKIVITYVPSTEAVFAPEVSVLGGDVFAAFDVELTCATADAKIYYTLNGGEEQTYAEAINITATTTLVAWAELGEDKSSEVTATYRFPIDVENIAAWITTATENPTTNVRITGEVVVTYVANGNTYIQDESGCLNVYDYDFDDLVASGSVVTNLVGKYAEYHGAVQLDYTPAAVPTIEAGDEVAPLAVNLDYIVEENLYRYVAVKNVELKADVTFTNGEASNADLVNGDELVRIRSNYKNIEGTFKAGDKVDVTGIVSIYDSKVQLYIASISISTSGPATAVDAIENANIYTENGMIVAEGEMEIFTVTGQNVTDMNGNLEKGIYVVRTANATAKVVVK